MHTGTHSIHSRSVAMVVDEAFDIVTFGKSTKKSLDSQLIGMYGNGLKS